jgi:hypothetical protein
MGRGTAPEISVPSLEGSLSWLNPLHASHLTRYLRPFRASISAIFPRLRPFPHPLTLNMMRATPRPRHIYPPVVSANSRAGQSLVSYEPFSPLVQSFNDLAANSRQGRNFYNYIRHRTRVSFRGGKKRFDQKVWNLKKFWFAVGGCVHDICLSNSYSNDRPQWRPRLK